MNRLIFDLSQSPEALMPCNLSDAWLDNLILIFDQMMVEDETEVEISDVQEGIGVLMLATTVYLCFAQHGVKTYGDLNLEITEDELYAFIARYAIELAEEHLKRSSQLKATLH